MDLQSLHRKERKNYYKLMSLFTVILVLVILVSVSLGEANISVLTVIKVIISKITRNNNVVKGIEDYKIALVWDVRMPRILMGAIVGAGLAVAGSIFQSILRNSLADPYTIGVSTGAAFGAVLGIYINLFIVSNPIPIMPLAFIFAILTLVIIIKIAGFDETLYSSNIILAGIIVSAILSSGISLLKSMSGDQVGAIIFWLMGSLSAKSWEQLFVAFPLIMISIFIAHSFADDLDILTLGSNEAKNVGVNADQRMKMYLILASLITAVCVSVTGIIGFVGLVIPHILRLGFSAKHRYLIPLSAVVGASLLSIADNFSRLLFRVEIPIGVITTLIGGPFFIYLFMVSRKRGLR
jgi:iron complex transport system permease protein